MTLLRIRCSLRDSPEICQWMVAEDGREPELGEGSLSDLPRSADIVQLCLPAAEVLLTRTQLPKAVKRPAESALAFSVEEELIGELQSNKVLRLGSSGAADVLAVLDKQSLDRWLDAIHRAGIRAYDICCETLLLPITGGEWSLAWDGHEGFVRTGQFEGAVTDCGERQSPPLSLRLLLEEAAALGTRPDSIALYLLKPDSAPDLERWQRELGVNVRLAGSWTWKNPADSAGESLLRVRSRWRPDADLLRRLRPAGWFAASAMAFCAIALAADWMLLAGERSTLRRQMEQRFRATFPDAVAVVDPVLQTRRKLTEARHSAGKIDGSDFLPMISRFAEYSKDSAAGSLRTLSYESGRLTVEFPIHNKTTIARLSERLRAGGLIADGASMSTRDGTPVATLTVRAQ